MFRSDEVCSGAARPTGPDDTGQASVNISAVLQRVVLHVLKVQFSSVQDNIYALGKTLFFSLFFFYTLHPVSQKFRQKVAFETVPMFV